MKIEIKSLIFGKILCCSPQSYLCESCLSYLALSPSSPCLISNLQKFPLNWRIENLNLKNDIQISNFYFQILIFNFHFKIFNFIFHWKIRFYKKHVYKQLARRIEELLLFKKMYFFVHAANVRNVIKEVKYHKNKKIRKREQW